MLTSPPLEPTPGGFGEAGATREGGKIERDEGITKILFLRS